MTNTDSPLSQRYGAGNAPARSLSNPVIDLMLRHRSVRGYKPDPLPEGALETIIAAAQSAASSSNLQTWSVVVVTDPAVKSAYAAIAGGQKHIEQCPVLLVFLCDLARMNRFADRLKVPHAGNDYLEMFLIGALDAALAAQNATLAAQSLGLSTCYIGSLRNDPEAVAKPLGLPPATAAVFGLCLGYASEGREGSIKPRLPQEAVVHRERYDFMGQEEALERYNAAMADFYVREKMNVTVPWTLHSARRIADAAALTGRHVLMQVLRRMGFLRAE